MPFNEVSELLKLSFKRMGLGPPERDRKNIDMPLALRAMRHSSAKERGALCCSAVKNWTMIRRLARASLV